MTSFSDILHPFSIADFLSSHWDKTSLHIRAEAPSKLSGLPGLSAFSQLFCGALGANGWDPPTLQGNLFATWMDAGGEVQSLNAPLSPSMASSLYNAGASLCFSSVENGHPSLRSLVDDVVKHTGFRGEIYTTAYLSPPRSGASLHFDPQHVFFCQVSGEKHWKVSKEPAVHRPPFHAMAALLDAPGMKDGLSFVGWPSVPPSESSLVDIVLKEGDVLYMPPGFWHEPRTTDSHSLHYTLTLSTISSWSALFSFLRMLMMKHPEWRRDLRFLDQSPGHREDEIVDRMLATLREELGAVRARDILKLYRDTETLPPDLSAWFRSP